MKKTITIILMSVLVMLSTDVATAQRRQMNTLKHVFTFDWQNTLPLGKAADVVSRYSFRGANFNYSFYFAPHFGVGLDLAWAYNDQLVPAKEYHPSDNVAIYAPGFKKTYNLPIKAQFKYVINPNNLAKVYLGAGLGATYASWYKQVQEMQVWNDSWGFLMSPEVGVMIPFGKQANWGLNVNAGYNWATSHAQNLYFSLGIFFGSY